MINKLFQTINSYTNTQSEAVKVRRQLQSIFLKIKTYQKHLYNDPKLNFKIIDETDINDDENMSGSIVYFIGVYVLRFDLDDLKSIQVFRRGKTNTLQYAELLAISFFNDIEYISDPLFVKLDINQLELSISHVISQNK